MPRKFKIILTVLLVAAVIAGVIVVKIPDNSQFLDLRLAVVTDSGVSMINVSPERRMINLVEVSGEREVWVPGGLGWYRSDRIKKLLEQEKKTDKVSQILFLNYGFNPEGVLWKTEWNGELSNQELLKYWGVKGWLNFRWNSGNWLLKKEVLTAVDGDEVIDEVMQRDMAETSLINQETKITVGNASNSDGLGAFVTKSLERSGLSVVDVVNINDNMPEKCLIKIGGNQGQKTETGEWLLMVFPECQEIADAQLDNGEVEIYFGQAWAEMINYQSYNK
jgi:hypothetical protein